LVEEKKGREKLKHGLPFFSSTKDTQRRDLRSALVEEKCGTVCDENVFLFSDEKFPITAAAHAERW
jgi:hypothetical protein